MHGVRRCLLTCAVAGIAACGNDQPPAGPDLTRPSVVLVTPDSLSIGVEDTARLRAVVLNVNGDTLDQAVVVFASVDTTVATIDPSGLVRGLSGGVSDVSVTSGDVIANAHIRVRVNGTLVVSPHVTLITQRDTLQLTVMVKDSNGIVVLPGPVKYHSADTAIVRVSPGGRVEFGGLAGSTRIDVISLGRRDAVFITALVDQVGWSVGGSALLEVRPDGNAFLFEGSSLVRFYIPSGWLGLGERWVIPYFGSIGDGVVNAAQSRVWISDRYFGNLVVMDLPGSGAVDTVASSTSFPNPYGPLSPTLAPGDSVLYYFADSYIYGLRLATNTKIDSVAIVGHQLAIRDSMLYALWPVPGEIQEYNILRRTRGRLVRFGREISDFVLSHDGGKLYAVTGTPRELRLSLWDLVTGDTLPSIELPPPNAVTSGATLAEQPSTGRVWVSSGEAARIYVVDVPARAVLRTLQPGGTVWGMGFAASGIGLLLDESGFLDIVK